MSTTLIIIYALLSVGVLIGIKLMSQVERSVLGNLFSALCMVLAVATTIIANNSYTNPYIWVGLGIGALLGAFFIVRVKMISMPQTVAFLNGLGGLASGIAAFLTIKYLTIKLFPNVTTTTSLYYFSLITAMLALVIGAITFSGSLIATGKLNKILPQKQTILPFHQPITLVLFVLIIALIMITPFSFTKSYRIEIATLLGIFGLAFGVVFSIRVGGADMPITISLLNSTSGVAAAIAGLAISDILLISIGGIVGASGLILTQIMCKAMNRNLSSIMFAKNPKYSTDISEKISRPETSKVETKSANLDDIGSWISNANEIIIIPGYGMALSQAQNLVKELLDKLENAGKRVRFAIHPVAGRMPGHMNVLLAEVDIPYDKLFEMDAINDDFDKTDLALVIGANDVINPAATTIADTPISGMPILNVNDAKHIVICNFDLKPGYAGVPNPLYAANEKIMLFLGDAKDSLLKIIASF